MSLVFGNRCFAESPHHRSAIIDGTEEFHNPAPRNTMAKYCEYFFSERSSFPQCSSGKKLSMQKEIQYLAEFINNKYWEELRSGIDFFSQFKNDLEHTSYIDFSLFILEHYHDSFCCEFFLSTHFIWAKKEPTMWIELIKKNTPRPPLPHIKNPIGKNSDIIFLQKYVEVDAINYLINNPEISAVEKIKIVDYFHYFWYMLNKNEHEAADLDGFYFVSNKDLGILKTKITNQLNLGSA
ncbi:hypothetical protein M5C97_21315 [Acidovorax sp. NCPPB 3859]|nr:MULTISPECIES: hypothetical protein [unclassified Acidovorax]MDA8451421.1 hypothetical protein [Acidovorax sp. GBBC 3297]MDA8460866.1 hypothetical protein [Acidovorax sp. GBBC 3333]MDA8466004.1 hypothetical protein [Acidovorax sp. GBBC 3332]MDA8470936.1 hypothetical protein [Acidovorax sp. GBBC 3299]WCM78013.1 hypothetical protein M5C94_21260 [Acidovorax sp. GBBC 712]